MSMTTTTPKPRNNKNEIELPEHRQKQVEAGLAMYQQIVQEREELEQKLRDAVLRIDGLNVQVSAMTSVVNMMESSQESIKLNTESRIREHQLQRDAAVTRVAELETTLMSIHSVLQNALQSRTHEEE
jgi:hypothetical protein